MLYYDERMIHMKLRILSLLLACLALLSLVACSVTPETTLNTTDAEQTTAVDIEEGDEVPFPDVDKQDYKGEDFLIISINNAGTWMYGDPDTYGKGSGNDQVINDVLYEMNTLVEDHLGIEIKYEYVQHVTGGKVIFDKVNPTVLSGDDVYQVCILPAYRNVAAFVTENCCLDFYELDDVDLDKPYWNREVIESLEISDHAYIAAGDICRYQAWPIYANKDMLEMVGRSVPYDKVRNGTWTFEEFVALTTELYADNGDGKINNKDVFGFAALWDVGANCFTQAVDVQIVTRDEDGAFEMTMYNDRFVDFYGKLLNWSKDEGVWLWKYNDRNKEDVFVNFLDKTAYFTQDSLGTQYLEAEFSVGILPLPKYDVTQAEYAHCNWGDNLCVPVTVKNTAMVGQALELMAYYSRTMVMPKYYDDVLQLRVSDAPDDREMVELIFDTMVFDPGIAYCDGDSSLFNLVYLPTNCVLQEMESISSYYTRNEKAASRFLGQKIYK